MRHLHSAMRLLVILSLCAGHAHAQSPATPLPAGAQFEPWQKILIISDNQEHLLTGGPVKSFSCRTDRFVTSVAVRSPLANAGGRLLMREAVRFGRERGAGMVLHLGDAADISCPDELSSVFDALDRETPNQMWFMAPGNHDGLFAGNLARYQEPLGSTPGELPFYRTPPAAGYGDIPFKWINACLSPSNYGVAARADIMTRGEAIRLYVERLKRRAGATWSAAPEPDEITMKLNGGKPVPVSCAVERIEIKSHGYAAVARICPRAPVPADPKKRWVGAYQSFIVQRLDVAGNRIVLLDTSNYVHATKVLNVIRRGELSKDQTDRAEEFFKADDGRAFDPKRVIMAGHHPLAQLPRANREWVAQRASRYLSGHAHASASLFKHRVKGTVVKELNVGSTLDFPPQAVLAYVGANSMQVRVAGADVSLTQWPGFVAECERPENKARWMLEPRQLYTGYCRGPYVTNVLAALRAAAARHADTVGQTAVVVPADTAADGWRLLDTVLQTINEAEGQSRTFWACQAYYASTEVRREAGLLAEKVAPAIGMGFKRGSEVAGGWLAFDAP